MRLMDIFFGIFILIVIGWVLTHAKETNTLAVTGIGGLNTTIKTLQGR